MRPLIAPITLIGASARVLILHIDGRLADEGAEGAHVNTSTDYTDYTDEMRELTWTAIGVICVIGVIGGRNYDVPMVIQNLLSL